MRSRQLKFIVISLCFLFSSSIFIFLNLHHISHFTSSASKRLTNETFLLVVITSAGPNINKRDVIRNTWLKLPLPESKYLFIIGGKDTEYDLEKLKNETEKHNDLVILHDTDDSYQSLTTKVLHAFSHINEFWKFHFLLKCDDDSFVRVANIASELKYRFHNIDNLYWGFFQGSANVKKKGKWKETKWVLCDRYLPYALGGGYVLSQSLVQFIANNQQYFVKFQPEDVSVGTWLAPVNVTRIHDPRFDTEYVSRGCSNSYLITHKHDITNMKYFYSTLKNTGNLCDAEYKLRLSYLYNWDVEPSKCCIRHNTSIP